MATLDKKLSVASCRSVCRAPSDDGIPSTVFSEFEIPLTVLQPSNEQVVGRSLELCRVPTAQFSGSDALRKRPAGASLNETRVKIGYVLAVAVEG